jgi:hypothetical protein
MMRLHLLDLGHHERALPDPLLETRHVLRPAHEGEADVVDALLEREIQILEILVRQRGRLHLHGREVDPFPAPELAAPHHLKARPVPLDTDAAELEEAVVHEDGIALVDLLGERRIRGGDLSGPRGLLGRDDHGAPDRQLDGLRELTHPDLRSGEVDQDRHRTPHHPSRLADRVEERRVSFVAAVGHVHPRQVHASLDQAADRRR